MNGNDRRPKLVRKKKRERRKEKKIKKGKRSEAISAHPGAEAGRCLFPTATRSPQPFGLSPLTGLRGRALGKGPSVSAFGNVGETLLRPRATAHRAGGAAGKRLRLMRASMYAHMHRSHGYTPRTRAYGTRTDRGSRTGRAATATLGRLQPLTDTQGLLTHRPHRWEQGVCRHRFPLSPSV